MLWIASSGGSSGCTRAASPVDLATAQQTGNVCDDFLSAYDAARCGDVVEVAGGTYSSREHLGHTTTGQNTDAKDCSGAAGPVVFVGNGASLAGGITVGEPWVTLKDFTSHGLTIAGWDSTVGCYTNPVEHVTVDGMTIDGGGATYNPMSMENVAYVTLENSSIGNITNGETEIHNGAACATVDNHVTLTGNTWHDFLNTNNASTHMECLQVDRGAPGTSNSHFTVSGNRFENCGQYDFFTSGSQSDFTVYNNWFDAPCSNQGSGCTAISVVAWGPTYSSDNFTNWVAEFNTMNGTPNLGYGVTGSNLTGNVYAYNIDVVGFNWSGQCGKVEHWTVSDNMDSSTAAGDGYVCSAGDVYAGSGDIAGDPTFVASSPTAYDYDLAVGSPGTDLLSPCPGDAPATDIHGNPRPASGQTSCSVGASEASG